MTRNRRYRMLAAGEHTYLWRVRHHHDEGCDEVLSIRRAASSSGRALHFRPKPGFAVPDGGTSAAGVVRDDAGRSLNLNEPGIVRSFIDVLTTSEWPTDDHAFAHLDGWAFLAQAHRQRTTADSIPTGITF